MKPDVSSENAFNLNQYALHPHSRFEGYYSKFTLPSGASVIVIICSVPNAPQWPNSLSLTYVPPSGQPVYQKEWKPEKLVAASASREAGNAASFKFCAADGSASLTASRTSVKVQVNDGEIKFEAECTSRTPWSLGFPASSPEGWLAALPLPLHWYVESLASAATFSLRLPQSVSLHPSDTSGTATAHLEKNWGHRGGFPSAHVWVQAADVDQGRFFCLAGGRTLGVEAFLLCYRNAKMGLSLDFRPPLALKFLGLSPFMSLSISCNCPSLIMTVCGWRYKIAMWATASEENFYHFSAPSPMGHKARSMAQTSNAYLRVAVYERTSVLGKWNEVCTDEFGRAGLEFGGKYLQGRGEKKSEN